jgi:hypothetical protein
VAQRFRAAIKVPLGLKPIPSASLVAALEGLRHPKSGSTWSFSAACFQALHLRF